MIKERRKAVVDISTETYQCPHCKGHIKLRQQFGTGDNIGSESHVITHISKRKGEEELELIARDGIPVSRRRES